MVIIGIPIAIAIPLYLNYEKGANDKAAQSDLRGAISTLELCNSNSAGTLYPISLGTVSGNTYPTIPGCSSQKITFSSNTTLTYLPNPANTPAGAAVDSAYVIEATNSGGTGAIYCYSSVTGGSVAKTTSSTVLTTYATACN